MRVLQCSRAKPSLFVLIATCRLQGEGKLILVLQSLTARTESRHDDDDDDDDDELFLFSVSLSLSVSPSSFLFFLSLSLSLSFSSLISVSLFILPLTYLLFENVVWLKPSSSGSRCITWWASHRIWFLEGMPPKTVQTAQELEDKYGSGITKRGVSIKGSYI